MQYVTRDESGCWLWNGTVSDTGYPQFRINGRSLRAHRVAYELFVGAIPDGLTIDHLCRVKRCVNPAHLEPVTAAENTRRATTLSWPRQCPKGHDMERRQGGEQAGRPFCRQCKNAIIP